jgi:hypothetical protein
VKALACWQLYESKQLKLPKSLRNQIAMVEEKGRFQDVGSARVCPQKLERYRPWQALGHNVARTPTAWTDEAVLIAAR